MKVPAAGPANSREVAEIGLGALKILPPFMGNWVSCFRRGDGRVTDVDRAVLDLKILQRSLRKRINGLERAVSVQKEAFRALAGVPRAKRKQELLLRHIGAIQKAIDQCHEYSYRADEMLLDIGEASMNQRVTETVTEATQAMSRMTKLMRVEDVEAMIRDGVEVRERHRELQAAMDVGAASDDRDEFHVGDDELDELREGLGRAPEQRARASMDSSSAIRGSGGVPGVRVAVEEVEERVDGLLAE